MFNNKTLLNKIFAAGFLVCLLLAAVFTALSGGDSTQTALAGDSAFGKSAAAVFLAICILLPLQIGIIGLKFNSSIEHDWISAVCLGIFGLTVCLQAFFSAGFLTSSALRAFAEQLTSIMFIPYLTFLYNQTTDKIAVSPILAIIITVSFLAQNIAALTGAVQLADLTITADILNIICLLTGFYIVFGNKKSEPLLYHCFGIGSLIFAFFYLTDTLATAAGQILFYIGFLAFAAAMHLWYCQKSVTAIQAETTEQILKEHSYIDYQTRCGSRLAFDEYYYCLEKHYSGTVQIGILVVDLNNLKETNDTYGNPVGDELVKDAAICITEVFGEEAKYFRTGGDEFAVLAINSDLDMEALMHRLDSKIIEYNANHVHSLSLARGLCIDEADVNDKNKLRIIYKAADDRMYGDKIEKHEQMKVQMIQEKYLKKQMLQEQMIREKQFREQMQKVAEAKEAEDLRKQQKDGNSENQDEQAANSTEQTTEKHTDFWNGKTKSKLFFGRKKAEKTAQTAQTPSQDNLTQTENAENKETAEKQPPNIAAPNTPNKQNVDTAKPSETETQEISASETAENTANEPAEPAETQD